MNDLDLYLKLQKLSSSGPDGRKRLVHFRDLDHFRIFKYNKNAFYSQAWKQYPELRQARGIVFDKNNFNVVCRPFDRAEEVELDADNRNPLMAEYKVNGFMAAVWFYDGRWNVSTTGSLESDFVTMAAKALKWTLGKLQNLKQDASVIHLGEKVRLKDLTLLFEICHESDPHIISEQLQGDGSSVWLIGARQTADGECSLLKPDALDAIAFEHIDCFRGSWMETSQAEIHENSLDLRHEGYMLRDIQTGAIIGKYKTPFYKTLKYLARTKKLSVNGVVAPLEASCWNSVHPDFRYLVDFIWNNNEQEFFANVLNEQQRLKYLKIITMQITSEEDLMKLRKHVEENTCE